MRLLIAILFAATSLGAHAQSACSSDGQAVPVALFERFISADCEACWGDATTPAPSATARAMVLDWIVPGKLGDDAPLSAAATTDALARLQTLGRTTPGTTDVFTEPVEQPVRAQLRVAHGLPFNDYLGTGISLAPARTTRQHQALVAPLVFRLLLVEAVPAATDGTAVPRYIVRNMLEGTWNQSDLKPGAKGRPPHWMETRSMRVPDGAQAERLRVVGWVQDAKGRIVAAAQSVCR